MTYREARELLAGLQQELSRKAWEEEQRMREPGASDGVYGLDDGEADTWETLHWFADGHVLRDDEVEAAHAQIRNHDDPRLVEAFAVLARRQPRAIRGAAQVAAGETARRRPRPRGAGATRGRRSRPSPGGSPARPADDDPRPLADLRRRCPRCGSVARPRLPSAQWTCDPCFSSSWERMVQHELGRVLAEADQILRGETA